VTSNFLANKNTIERNILCHLRLFPIENFFQIFSEQISQNSALKVSDIYRIGQSASNYLHSIGAFSIAEEVEVFVKTTCDGRYERDAGIRNESSYLTAVGHMSLMGILIMAKRVGFIEECEITILFDKLKYSNSLFSKILMSKAEEVGIQLLPAANAAETESDLELYPVNIGRYEIARYCYSSIFREFESKYSRSFLDFEDIDKRVALLAEEILDRHGIKNHDNLVGIHVRQDQLLNQANRNSDLKKFLDSIAWLESVGYTVVRLGHSNTNNPEKIGSRSIDTSQMDISQYERDAINLYVWSKAQFFIGNLSGGTFPPSLFGVPTLYVDVFPFTHLTLPGVKDSIVPKRLFDLKAQNFLSWEESFSKSKTHLQIENSLQLSIQGFQLISYDPKEMLTCIQRFVNNLDNFRNQEYVPLRRKALDAEGRFFEFMQRLIVPA
jgi:putative glycosyltransferase (TIGR04372 family)